jgi:ribosomal protein S18 acetylase RimI-like enzyme
VVDEKIVGYTSIYTRMISDEIEDGKEAYGLVGDLVVLENHRGRGYGKKLIERAEAAAKENGVRTLGIGVLSQNTVAADLYASLGFKPFSMQLEKSL